MRNILARLGVPTYITFMIAGCGTFVPEIQEFPGSSVDGQLLVHAIVNSIHCEIRNAVTYVIDQDKKVAQLNHEKAGLKNAENNHCVQRGKGCVFSSKYLVFPVTAIAAK
jgi:hypothetical protein